MLEHSESGHRYKSIESNADSANNTCRNRLYEQNERIEECKYDTQKSCCDDRPYGSISGDGNASYRFAVRGIGASAEHCPGNRTYAVTEKGFVKSRVFKKIAFDYR